MVSAIQPPITKKRQAKSLEKSFRYLDQESVKLLAKKLGSYYYTMNHR